MWSCPTCGRIFKHIHQDHSCEVHTIDDHLINANPNIVKTFHLLNDFILKLSHKVRCSPLKNAILYDQVTSFVALKTRKKYLQIEFTLDRLCDFFPVYKTVKISLSKHCHFIRLEDPSEINTELLDWIKEAYQLSIKS
jgi:predicted transport protein